MIHKKQSELAGKTVKLKANINHPQFEDGIGGAEYRVEDWWDRVGGKSWKHTHGNPACIVYRIRSEIALLPHDDEVLYGKIGVLGHLIHISEIETEMSKV